MKTIQEILDSHTISSVESGKDGFKGVYTSYKWQGSIICSTGGGWEHVSVAPFKRNYIPTYDDLCSIKRIFWNDDEDVIHVFPNKDNYVNNVENCLHLWRCSYKPMVLPPSCFVGIKKGQTRSELEKEIKAAYELAGEKYEL